MTESDNTGDLLTQSDINLFIASLRAGLETTRVPSGSNIIQKSEIMAAVAAQVAAAMASPVKQTDDEITPARHVDQTEQEPKSLEDRPFLYTKFELPHPVSGSKYTTDWQRRGARSEVEIVQIKSSLGIPNSDEEKKFYFYHNQRTRDDHPACAMFTAGNYIGSHTSIKEPSRAGNYSQLDVHELNSEELHAAILAGYPVYSALLSGHPIKYSQESAQYMHAKKRQFIIPGHTSRGLGSEAQIFWETALARETKYNWALANCLQIILAGNNAHLVVPQETDTWTRLLMAQGVQQLISPIKKSVIWWATDYFSTLQYNLLISSGESGLNSKYTVVKLGDEGLVGVGQSQKIYEVINTFTDRPWLEAYANWNKQASGLLSAK